MTLIHEITKLKQYAGDLYIVELSIIDSILSFIKNMRYIVHNITLVEWLGTSLQFHMHLPMACAYKIASRLSYL